VFDDFFRFLPFLFEFVGFVVGFLFLQIFEYSCVFYIDFVVYFLAVGGVEGAVGGVSFGEGGFPGSAVVVGVGYFL
jgi:hypothetical protein